jgi:arsenate reductase
VEGDDSAKRRAFELTRQALGYRCLQLLSLPLAEMDRADLHQALTDIANR